MSDMITAVRASLVAFVLCGLLYPLALTGLGQLILPFQANGSLERGRDGTIIGSRLIGQNWSGPQWFHGRPSATTAADPGDPSKTVPAPYNPANSAGSNLGPTSRRLMERLMSDRRALEAVQPELVGRRLPSDILTTSASGLDPDITPDNAALQAARVARARGVPVAAIEALLARQMTGRSLGIFGEPRVNVLALNLALERAFQLTRSSVPDKVAADLSKVDTEGLALPGDDRDKAAGENTSLSSP
jgi:potassium-transporting ATPase KdpC subunit